MSFLPSFVVLLLDNFLAVVLRLRPRLRLCVIVCIIVSFCEDIKGGRGGGETNRCVCVCSYVCH